VQRTSASNEGLPSTTFYREVVRIRRPLQGQCDSPRRGRHAWRRMSKVSRRRAVRIEVYLLNGSECVLAVKARGLTGFITGDVSLYDVWAAVTNNL
jgi:hypothetical protein